MAKIITFYTVSIVLCGFASALGLVYMILKLDPYARASNPLILQGDLFILIFSLGFGIGYFLRRKFGVRELLNEHFKDSVRQGLWLAILVVGSMFLLINGLFTWWNDLLLLVCLVFLESYFLFK